MQIYFHSRLCSYLPRVPILVEDTVNLNIVKVVLDYSALDIRLSTQCNSYIFMCGYYTTANSDMF